jgi:hypothetical protein
VSRYTKREWVGFTLNIAAWLFFIWLASTEHRTWPTTKPVLVQRSVQEFSTRLDADERLWYLIPADSIEVLPDPRSLAWRGF